ncbi:G-type lectin S-receptor-like serine/threonine-protein kinase LECRK1 [Papaver somniferum]|uniref:G-type lectin S-receptor-like serine/threonine-protein kinase LECRK1 n=1 Tax=Papaver somniferum TaxID=3469 RepID=UPI000E704B8F|nr:G-type lectin S-receptor-like serine/threonine-protein kinase LECRK1 [Papaver somniferum]
MKFQQTILSMSFLLLQLPLLVVEPSSFNDRNITSHTSVINKMRDSSNTSMVGNIIRRGSSISIVGDICSSYWPSSSCNVGFGFYKLCSSQDGPDEFVVGISFFKPRVATLVWSTNRYYSKPSSVLITNEGKFVLRMKPDDKEEPLIPNIQEPVAFAMMHENENFVLYGSESQIVWQSFDYPTHTVLGGQQLRAGFDLVSKGSRLSVEEISGSVEIHAQSSESVRVSIISDALLEGSLRRLIFLSLSTTGDLYLSGSDGVVLKYIYLNKNHQQRQQGGTSIVKEDDYLYMARLSSYGYFMLEYVAR